MKYCKNCDKEFDTEKNSCPVCGKKLVISTKDGFDDNSDDEVTAEIISSTTITGIL